MNRAPFVLAGTALGLGAVLSIHTGGPATATASASSASSSSSVAVTAVSASTTASASAATTTAKRTTTATTKTVATSDIPYQYGDLELKLTLKDTAIVGVSVAQLNVTDPRSAQIDQYAIPQLIRETLAAKSAKINTVSGASYTSAAFEQALASVSA